MADSPAEEASARNFHYQLLLDVSQKLAATLEPSVILQTAVDGLTRLSGLDTAAVYLVTDQQLQLWATMPPLPSDFPEEFRLSPLAEHPHINWTIESAEPQLIPDFPSVNLNPSERSICEQRQLRTVLIVPLICEHQVVGVFMVGSIAVPVTVSQEIIVLSTTLSHLTALAVKNAQLYQDNRKRAVELQQALDARLEADKERIKLQEALIQSQKMESIGRLAGGIAHDFNNMLSLIMGNAELALRKLPKEHVACSHLRQIHDATQRSAELTRQLLGFARRQTISPKLVDINQIIEKMLGMLARLLGENIDLAWYPQPLSGKVLLDPSQVDQLLVNLCVNARDAITSTGKVTIETRDIEFDADYCALHPEFQPGDYTMVAVSDDGCGMDMHTRKHIFEPYFTTKDIGKGTGLGLSTVYGIVKQNGGFINVYSELGQGSCFKIYLRRQISPEPSPVEASTLPPRTLNGDETILLVEDEQKVLDLEQEILESFGYRVLAANSPHEALVLAEKTSRQIDLLITDVVMPQMNGKELADRLQKTIPNLQVLFLSGYTANVIAHHGVLYDGVVFLGKPFSKEQLGEKIREVLYGSSEIPG